MINYLKNNHLSLLIIAYLVIAPMTMEQPAVPQPDVLGAVRSITTFTNPITFSQEIVVNEDGTANNTRIEGDTNSGLVTVDATNDQVTVDGLTQGSNSGCFATSTTGTLTETDLMDYSCIYITATGAGQATISLTLPATSTMTNLIANESECRDWWIDASDVAAATTTTIVAGTGWDLVGLDATGAGTGADVIDGAEFGRLTACRQDGGQEVTGFLQEYLHAD